MKEEVKEVEEVEDRNFMLRGEFGGESFPSLLLLPQFPLLPFSSPLYSYFLVAHAPFKLNLVSLIF